MKLEEKKQYIQTLLKDDPLFKALVARGYDTYLYADSFLEEINVAGTYGTVKVAGWFNVSDSQLRYYIKPNVAYLVEEETPVNEFAYRLTFSAIIKLRMMFLLKDDYKMKGLELLINEEAKVFQGNPENTLSLQEDELNRLEAITHTVEQILKTGIFNIERDEETKELDFQINTNFFEKFSHKLSAEEKEKEKLLLDKKDLQAELRTEYLRLEKSENRIEDFNSYLAFLNLKQSTWIPKVFTKRNDAEITEFIGNTKEKIEIEQEKVEVVKETIKAKEMEITKIDKQLDRLSKSIEGPKSTNLETSDNN